jgi:Flp pilus assembly pilin Flp
VKLSAPPVWRPDFGRRQKRAFGGAQARRGIMRRLFHRFIDDRSGVTAIEYSLIAALISIVIITSVRTRYDDFDHVLWADCLCFLMAPAPRQLDLANSPLSVRHARREIICGGAPPVPPGDPLRLPRAIIRLALEWTLKDHA